MLLRHARASLAILFALAVAVGLSTALATGALAAPFDDVVGSNAEDAVVALAGEGVLEGCGEGQFCPDAALTRGQMATVLSVALELEPSGVTPFDDAQQNAHAEGIDALATAGIVRGCTESSYCPNDTVTRGQLATMLAVAFYIPEAERTSFDDTDGMHGDAAERLATYGIAAGCVDPLTHFCIDDEVSRANAAQFLARALGLVPNVEVSPLAERRAEQEAIDAARRAEQEAAAARAAEEEAAKRAAAEAEAVSSRLHVWEALAQCESGGNWSINTGNGYYGGLQFHPDTWRSVGGSGLPHQNSKSEQIRRGEILQQRSGWGQWPACSRKLGLR